MTSTESTNTGFLEKQASVVYTLLGAAIGAIQGVTTVAREATGKRVHEVLDQVQNTTEESAVRATQKAYEATGALSGIFAGARYGLLSFWWTITDDDIKVRLLQASPVKYRLKELDFRGVAAATNYSHSTAVATAAATAAAPTVVTSSSPAVDAVHSAVDATQPQSISSPPGEDYESFPSSSPESRPSSDDFPDDRQMIIDQDDSPRVLSAITNKI